MRSVIRSVTPIVPLVLLTKGKNTSSEWRSVFIRYFFLLVYYYHNLYFVLLYDLSLIKHLSPVRRYSSTVNLTFDSNCFFFLLVGTLGDSFPVRSVSLVDYVFRTRPLPESQERLVFLPVSSTVASCSSWEICSFLYFSRTSFTFLVPSEV